MSATVRKFMYNGTILPDFDPTMKPEEIKTHYASQHAELTTANVVFSKDKKTGEQVFEFKKSAGTKG